MVLKNYHNITLYTGIAISMSLALSIFVLLILLMQSVNWAQSLNNTLLFLSLLSLSVSICASVLHAGGSVFQ